MIELLMAQWGFLTLGVWVLTEMLVKIPAVKKRIHTNFLALMIGTFGAVVLSMADIFERPEDVSDLWWVASMIFLGAISVAAAGVANDKIIAPLKKPFKAPDREEEYRTALNNLKESREKKDTSDE